MPSAEPASAAEPAPAAAATPNPEVALAPTPPAEAAAPAPAAPAAPAPSSQARAQAEELVRSVVAELPNFIGVAVVEGASGLILAGQWVGDPTGEAEAAAANAEIVRQVRQATEAMQLAPAEEVRDIVITLHQYLHLLQVLPQHNWLLYLAMRTEDTNLALARTVLRQHAA